MVSWPAFGLGPFAQCRSFCASPCPVICQLVCSKNQIPNNSFGLSQCNENKFLSVKFLLSMTLFCPQNGSHDDILNSFQKSTGNIHVSIVCHVTELRCVQISQWATRRVDLPVITLIRVFCLFVITLIGVFCLFVINEIKQTN